ncbi:glycoside hydrolase family 6 protein [bacterium]|nr:glycoside hydrolase family 6 protein [bacterium]
MQYSRYKLPVITLTAIFVYISGALLAPFSIPAQLVSRISARPDNNTPQQNQPRADQATPPLSPQASSSASPTASSTAAQASGLPKSGNPFIGEKLYVSPYSPAARQRQAWAGSRPSDAALMNKIASNPVAIWLGDWTTNPNGTTRSFINEIRSGGALPVFVLYNIPIRDCGSYSAGGASSAQSYQQWIHDIQAASANTKSIFLLEPDALAGWDCLSPAQKTERINLLRYAVDTLTSSPNHYVYLDAGNARWHTAAEVANRLKQVGTQRLSGISINISNFLTTEESRSYGQQISQLSGGLGFVIDTSRNGRGPTADLDWCNPPDRGLGETPKAMTTDSLHALLWIKYPGESDGSCKGAPTAGEWWPEYALGLAARASF